MYLPLISAPTIWYSEVDRNSSPAPDGSQVVVVGDRRTGLEARRTATRCRGRCSREGSRGATVAVALFARNNSRRWLGLGNPGSLQEAGNNTCFCLIPILPDYKYLSFPIDAIIKKLYLSLRKYQISDKLGL